MPTTDFAAELAALAHKLEQPRYRIFRDIYDRTPDRTGWIVTRTIYRGSFEIPKSPDTK